MKIRLITAAVAIAIVGCATVTAANADTLAQWNFNTESSFLSPSVGSGSIGLLGTAAGLVVSGKPSGWSTHWSSSDGQSTDPIAGPSPNQYAAYCINNVHTAGSGYAVTVSTLGYTNITATLDARLSGSTTRNWTWIYSTDGGVNWFTQSSETFASGTTWQNGKSVSLSNAVDNISNLKIGFVTADAVAGTSNTIRIDMLTISGTVVPEPGSIVALGTGLVGLFGYIRRRSA